MKGIIQFFQGRSLLVNLLTVLVLAGGFITASQINKEGYPQVDRKRMIITTIYPGASPQEVELNVTIPLEESFKSINGIKEYSSISRANVSIISVILDNSYPDPDKTRSDIRRAIDNTVLPDEVSRKPQIREWKVSEMPVMEIALFTEELPYGELRLRAKDLKKKILNIPLVSQVNEKAIQDREIKILLDIRKMNRLYISVEEIIRAIQVNNFEMSGGILKERANDKIITVSSKFQTVEDVGKIILRSTFEGSRIYLRDVARIEDSFEEASTQIRLNGHKGVALQVVKKESADILKTTDQVLEAMEEFRTALEGVDINVVLLWELADETRSRLNIVSNNAVIGLVLVVLILLLFMNGKNAFWTAMGIPFSIGFAMILLPYFNVTINSISLLGMIVVLGMVVDDAIVISENIYQHRVMGKSWQESAVHGTMEVAYPVITTVATTILAFLPLMNIKGVMGEFAKEIPLVVIFILLGSLLESLFILPNHVSHNWFKGRPEKPLEDRKFIVALRRGYTALLARLLPWRYVIVLVFVAAFAWSWYALFSGRVLKFISFPTEDATYIEIEARVMGGQSLAYTGDQVRRIEDFILSRYTNNIYRSFDAEIGEIGYPENFQMVVYLTPAGTRDIKAEEIVSDLKKLMGEAGTFTNILFKIQSGGPPQQRAVRIDIIGNDNTERRKIADEFVDYFQSIPGTRDLIRSDEQNKKEVRILVDYASAARVGVSPISIAQVVRASFNGIVATSIQTPNELVEYRVMLDENFRKNLSTLNQLYVLNNQQKLVKLRPLVKVDPNVPLVSKIEHYQGDRNTIIELDLDLGKITPKELYDRLHQDTKDFEKKNPGFRLIIGGEAQDSNEVINSYIRSAIIGILSIFAVLVLLFRSVSQAFLVLLAVPFSFIGIALTLIVHGEPLTSMALFGGVGLIGVVVNDSLVMVDYINSLRDRFETEGMLKLVVEGAATRLRPVILTTVTTVAGLLPTAYGLGGRDFMIMPTTLVMAWGLVFATLLTLFLIPSLYIMEYEIHRRLKQSLAQAAAWAGRTAGRFWKKRKIPVIVVLLSVLGTGGLYAQTNTTAKVIGLEEFISLSLANHPRLYSELLKIRQARSLELQARAIYNFLFEGNYNHALMVQGQTNNTDLGILEQEGDQLDLYMAGMLPAFGTRLKAGVSYQQSATLFVLPTNINFTLDGSQVRIDSYDSGLSNLYTYQPEIYVEFSQPLLRNWLGIQDRFPLFQAELNREMQEINVSESIETLIIQLYQMYFEWYLAWHRYRILSDSLNNAETLLVQVKNKQKYGMTENSDVYQVMVMREELYKARSLAGIQYQVTLHKILRWMTGNLEVDTRSDILPQQELILRPIPDYGPRAADSRQMKILNLTRALLDIQLEKEFNNNLPELNLVGRLSLGHLNSEADQAFRLQNFNPGYAVGLQFSYPLGENLSRGKIKELKSQIKQWQKESSQFERSYTQGVDDLRDMVRVYQEVLVRDTNILSYTSVILEEEKKKYSQGRSDLYLVIRIENDLLKYQIQYMEDYVQYFKVRLDLLGLLDLLPSYQELIHD